MSERFNDPTDALKEQQRREDLKANAPLQRGIAAAASQEKTNRRGELEQHLKDLARVAIDRDKNQNGRDCYDRKWRSTRNLAQRFATSFNEKVSIPDWIPPPTVADTDRLEIVPEALDIGVYRERGGLSPDGKGLPPLPMPGTAADNGFQR